MENIILKEIAERKENLKANGRKLLEAGIIDKETFKNISDRLNNDKLVLGVIGQMKAGKSTFLNAFIFGKPVLPSATTPMTAALSIITYGEKEELEAEFYTQEEWEEQLSQADRNVEEISDPLIKSKINAAKELVAQAKKTNLSVHSYLGQTKRDTLENLIEYVGADGKFVAITKSVKIYYPADYLKGVEIVDTPGFNDPIVSREVRTKDFLSKADVVLMLTYAGRPFDETDKKIIFDNLAICGVGKLVIGVNKYDCSYENGEDENDIINYVKEQLDLACNNSPDKEGKIIKIIKAAKLFPISAEMALLANLPMQVIKSYDKYDYSYKRYLDVFEIGGQTELYVKSKFEDLSSYVKEIVVKEKEEILFSKIRTLLEGKCKENISEIEKKIALEKDNLNNYSLSDKDLEKKFINIKKAQKSVNKNIDDFVDESDNILITKSNELRKSIKFSIDKFISDIDNLYDEMAKDVLGFKSREQAYANSFDQEYNKKYDKCIRDSTAKIQMIANERMSDIKDVIEDYIPDLNAKNIVGNIYSMIISSLDDNMTTPELGDKVRDDIKSIGFGFWKRTFSAESTNESYRDSFISYLKDLKARLKDLKLECSANLSEIIQGILAEKVFNVLNDNLAECERNKQNKEVEIKRIKCNIETLEKSLVERKELINPILSSL